MSHGWNFGIAIGQRCYARLSDERGYCRAWALNGKRRCKWHGGMSTGPRTAEGLASTISAMRWGRFRRMEYRHALGLKAPGGRPSRIPDELRRLVIEEAEKECAGCDPDAIRAAEPPPGQSEAEELADLDVYWLVLLLAELRLPVGTKNRNRVALRIAFGLADVRYERVKRGDRQRCRLDQLIEELALCWPSFPTEAETPRGCSHNL